ncbi:glycosyltransferase family 39 protein [Nocardia wallacei]|uniref:glycosyltransferase family 39 protein n=1 Tax=Nocardia wallacei TaxID=480035 RepID=UPI0024582CCD|nr:glycosyltransferase family 39 protein [Nocardia wallacei]
MTTTSGNVPTAAAARSDAVGTDASEALPPFAFRPILAIAGVAAAVLLARADRYDYFGDELYFLAAGRRLAFGYVDQGPLLPLLAWGADALAPGSLVTLRFPAILATVAAIVVTAALAREFGGRRAAQVTAALGYATCPFLVTQAATLSTFALDTTLTAALVWLLVRWNRIRDDRLLLAVAVVAAVDIQVKLLMPVLLLGIGVGIALCGPRELLRRHALWLCALVLGGAALPGLLWQAGHGWPQVAMGGVIRAEQQAATGGVPGLPLQLVLLVGLLGGILAAAGLWAWTRASATSAAALYRNRFAAVTVLCQLLFLVATGTRPYYLAGLFPVVFAAGALWLFDRETRWMPTAVTVSALVSAAIVGTVLFVLPLPAGELRQPTETQGQLSARLRMFGTTGWDRLEATVRDAYRDLPPEARSRAVIVTHTYWQASALDRRRADLPPVYSPDRGFAHFGTPPETATTVLYVAPATAEPELRRTFSGVRPVARLDDRLGFPGIDRKLTVWRCDRPVRSWADTWPALTTNVLDAGI